MTTTRASASLDEFQAAFLRLDLRLRLVVEVFRSELEARARDPLRGLCITEEEVDKLLASAPPAEIAQRLLSVPVERIVPRIRQLALLFGLTDFEQEVLLICLAPEVDLRYERLYAYLQDDVTLKRPTVDLVMRLLCPTVKARLGVRKSFAPDAPLLRWNLLTVNDDPGARRPVLLARYLKLDERIVGYLLGADEIDSRLSSLVCAQPTRSTLELSEDRRERLQRWAEAWDQSWSDSPPVILLHGRYGAGKQAAAQFLAATLDRPLLLLSAAELQASDLTLSEGLKLAEREAILAGAVLGWSEVDCLLFPQPGVESGRRAFIKALALGGIPTVLLSERSWEPARELGRRPFLRMQLHGLTYAERQAYWSANLDSDAPRLTDHELSALAGRFRLSAGQIGDALARARTIAWERDPLHGCLETGDIDAACRSQAQHRLSSLAQKVDSHYAWDDIVLPKQHLTTLRLICTTVRHRPTVYGDWGFDRKLLTGKGLIALFAGPSGTGKTMAAGILAHDLGLDLYKIDLSSVVNKYIGETEKNLERIFAEAQDSNAILFFDEADALFGKRSEVKDAHDRYANIEISYLLQRTEEYDGLVILASNLKKNIDEAFVRRLQFIVDFPMPEEAERLDIWRRTFPSEAPRSGDIDLSFLARKLKITGGNIRNIILTSAFLAAEDGQPISMRHVIRGAGYEFQKMGKLVVEGDFEQYYELVRT